MAVHMAESPIGCMAAAHSVAATENFLALEYHSVDVPWWDDHRQRAAQTAGQKRIYRPAGQPRAGDRIAQRRGHRRAPPPEYPRPVGTHRPVERRLESRPVVELSAG